MFQAMTTVLHTSSERVHVALTVALSVASVANMLLVCAWL
jgi:hypothetical protein